MHNSPTPAQWRGQGRTFDVSQVTDDVGLLLKLPPKHLQTSQTGSSKHSGPAYVVVEVDVAVVVVDVVVDVQFPVFQHSASVVVEVVADVVVAVVVVLVVVDVQLPVAQHGA